MRLLRNIFRQWLGISDLEQRVREADVRALFLSQKHRLDGFQEAESYHQLNLRMIDIEHSNIMCGLWRAKHDAENNAIQGEPHGNA